MARGAQEGLDLEPLRDDPGLQPVGRAGARRGAVIDRSGPQLVLAGLDVGDLEIDAVEGVELVIAIFLPEGGDIDFSPGAVPFDAVFLGVELARKRIV